MKYLLILLFLAGCTVGNTLKDEIEKNNLFWLGCKKMEENSARKNWENGAIAFRVIAEKSYYLICKEGKLKFHPADLVTFKSCVCEITK